MSEDIHSCSYYCMKPACILGQRNALVKQQEGIKPVAYRFKSPLSEEGEWEYGKESPVGTRWDIETLYTIESK
jgi:hypothetical protein